MHFPTIRLDTALHTLSTIYLALLVPAEKDSGTERLAPQARHYVWRAGKSGHEGLDGDNGWRMGKGCSSYRTCYCLVVLHYWRWAFMGFHPRWLLRCGPYANLALLLVYGVFAVDARRKLSTTFPFSNILDVFRYTYYRALRMLNFSPGYFRVYLLSDSACSLPVLVTSGYIYYRTQRVFTFSLDYLAD